MTRYQPLWQQSGTYQASLDRQLIDVLCPNGGANGNPPVAVNNTMNISVPAGTCVVPLSDGSSALCVWDAAEVVTLAAAPPSGQARQDLVVCQVRDNAIDSGGNNDFIITSVTGTQAAAGSAVPPAVPANAYPLCQVGVGGAVANLNTAAIYPRRAGILPGANALYYRNAAFTVAGAPGVGGWLDTMDHDDFGNVYGLPSGRNDNMVRIPAAGTWRLEFQAVASQSANGWIEARLMSPQNTSGTRYGWWNQCTPVANWVGARALAQGRYPQGMTFEPWMNSAPAGPSGITGVGATFLQVTYLGP